MKDQHSNNRGPHIEYREGIKTNRRRFLQATAGSTLLAGKGIDAIVAPATAAETTDMSGPSVSGSIFEVYYPENYKSSAEQTLDWAISIHESLTESLPSTVDITDETINILLNTGNVSGKMNWEGNPYRIHAQLVQNDRIGPVEWRATLAHEYMNIVLNDHSRDESGSYPRSPLWFREGLSDHYVYQHTSEEITEERFPTRFIEQRYEEIRNGLGYFELMTKENYSGGYLITTYSIEEHGAQPHFDLLAMNGNWEDDVEEVLGVTYDEWRRGWLEWAEENVGGDYNVKVASIQELDEMVGEQQKTIDELRSAVSGEYPTLAAVPEELFVGQKMRFSVEIPAATEDTEFSWDFGDGNTGTGKSTTHSFTEPGQYDVKLTATFEDGTQQTQTQSVTVSEPTTESENGGDDSDSDNTDGQAGEETDDQAGEETDDQTEEETDDMETRQSDSRDSNDGFGPGFGLGTGLTALGGLGYLLKRRVSMDEDDGSFDT